MLKPGTGKTYIAHQTIMETDGVPALFVSLKYVLYQHYELLKDTYKCKMLLTPKDFVDLDKYDVLMCPESMLHNHWGKLISLKFKYIVYDESHLFKTYRAERTKAALCLSLIGTKKILLSATPRPENAGEIYPQICLINYTNELGTLKEFESKYLRKSMGSESFWKVKYIKEKEIMRIASKYMFYEDVPMPEQLYKYAPFPLSEKDQKLYDDAKNECSIYIEQCGLKMFLLSNLHTKLLQLCCGHIIDPITKEAIWLYNTKIDTIKEIISQHPDEKILIWSHFRMELEQLSKSIVGSKLIYGGTTGGDKIIEDFKNGSLKILIAHPQCIGAGLSFEMCHIQIISSISESGCLFYQMKTRTNRLSQKEQEILYFVYPSGTILKDVFKKVNDKNLTEKVAIKEAYERYFNDRSTINR